MGGYVEYDYDPQGNLESALQGGPSVTTVLTSLSHDLRGRKTAMTAPDHGSWSYVHNAFGELVSQTDAKQQITTATFDRAGRLIRRDHYGAGENPASIVPLDRAEWIWIQGKMVLEDTYHRLSTTEMEPLPRLARNFVYDLLGRVEEVHTTIQGTNYVERTTYDQYGRVFQTFDASGVDRGAEHLYNAHGYLAQGIEAQFSATTTQVHYEVLGMNARGQITSQRKVGTTETRQYHPATGMPDLFQVSNAAQQTLDTQTFDFDVLGNLTARTQGSHSETMQYDGLNRLKVVSTSGSAPNLSMDYDALGNIESKSNVGSYSYGAGSAGPHAVTSAGGVSYAYDANGNMISGNGRTISWMPFNKPAQIQQSNRSVSFAYGPMRERYQRTDSTSSGTTTTRYVGSVEIITRPGGTELKRYLPGGVVVTVTGTTSERLALFHDHLDSVTLIVDDAGQVAQRLAFDAFGKRRSTVDWTTLSDSQIWGFNSLRTTRGFTFHEQLDPVGLVHMNGRVYDPHLGRFLSPDPFVQAPGDTQNLNRYSYVNNNPLSYTDPSGYFLKKIGKAIGKAFKKAVKGVLEFGVGVAVKFGEVAALSTPMGAFIFFASAAYHVSRATQRSGGHSPPGAFGNGGGGNAWRGGGRTVFVPALNEAHGHGFHAAGLTGFALQGHQAGVEAGDRHTSSASSDDLLVQETLDYLLRSPTFADMYTKARAAGVRVVIDLNRDAELGGGEYDIPTNTILWDPFLGTRVEDGIISPAITLAHEYAHAVRRHEIGADALLVDLESPIRRNPLEPWRPSRYGVPPEEERATRVQDIVAGELGEVLRREYRHGVDVRVTGPTYRCRGGDEC